MNRGEIYWVKCAAACGSEMRKDRPALIVSNELCNKHSPVVEIVYLTTKEKKPLPTHVETYRGGRKQTVLCEQIQSVSKERIGERLWRLDQEEMKEVDRALAVSLGLVPAHPPREKREERKNMEKPIFALIAAILAVLIAFSLMITAQAQELTIEGTFERAAYAYRLDLDLLVSIATLESGYGQSAVAKNRNNWFGWTRSNGSYMDFETPQAGIWHVARAISRRPHGSIEEIAAWYNAPFADIWAERVRRIYASRNK